ncbi:hypothetical protein [Sorangium sp. So ce1153]|uniref:hypothetical protein n=1 Tax=Sorangium sp. So ce1153 TaxID=3133333 RepID=UPI003F6196D3
MEAKTLNIILVEDDEDDVMGVQRALRGITAAFSLWIAHDGVEALALLRGDQVPAKRRLMLVSSYLRGNSVKKIGEVGPPRSQHPGVLARVKGALATRAGCAALDPRSALPGRNLG